jgi:hypothetical protein
LAKPFHRPLRISMGLAAMKSMPEDVAKNLLRDEIHSTLLSMEVPLEKVEGCDDELLSSLLELKKIPEEKAFGLAVEKAKKCLLRLGVDPSVVSHLQFE